MKRRMWVLALIGGFTFAAVAQTATESHGPVEGYWVDPQTKLMWASKDNGKAVTWHDAVSYCRNSRLAAYHDWRLGTLDELASLIDKSEAAPGQPGNKDVVQLSLSHHVRGSILLTGDPWSSNRERDRFGHPYGPGWFFNFRTCKPSYDLQQFRNTKYALCVRRSTE